MESRGRLHVESIRHIFSKSTCHLSKLGRRTKDGARRGAVGYLPSSIIGETASRALYISSFYPRSNSCPSVRPSDLKLISCPATLFFLCRLRPRSFDLIAPLHSAPSAGPIGAFGVWAGGTRVWNIPCSRHKYLALEICRPASAPRFTAAVPQAGYQQQPALNLSPSASIAPKGFFQPSRLCYAYKMKFVQ